MISPPSQWDGLEVTMILARNIWVKYPALTSVRLAPFTCRHGAHRSVISLSHVTSHHITRDRDWMGLDHILKVTAIKRSTGTTLELLNSSDRTHHGLQLNVTIMQSMADSTQRHTTHLACYVLLHSSSFRILLHPLPDTGDGKRDKD